MDHRNPSPNHLRWVRRLGAWSLATLLGLCCLGCATAQAGDATPTRPTGTACRRGGDAPTVIAACSDIIATSRESRALEKAYNLRGLAYEAAGQFQAAADDAGEVIRRDPKVAGFFDNRARAYRGLGRPDLALTDANTAVRMARGYAFVFHGRGSVYSDLARYDLALRDYGTALSLDPADAGLLVERGRVLAALDRPEEAAADFTTALAIRPTDPTAARERGLVRRRLGDQDGARADLRAALASGLQDDVAVEALRQIDAAPATAGTATTVTGQVVAQFSAAQQSEQQAKDRIRQDEADDLARKKAAEELKAERLARDVAVANHLLDDAAAFVKVNRDDPARYDLLGGITRLTRSLQDQEPVAVENGTRELQAQLALDPVYAAYTRQKSAERYQEKALNLTNAQRKLRLQREFLVDAAAQDARAAMAREFMSLADQAQAAQSEENLDRAEVLVGRIDTAIDRAGLQESYGVFARSADGLGTMRRSGAQPTPGGLQQEAAPAH